CSRFLRMDRTTAFSAVLVINIFSVADSANDNNPSRHIKQDPVVAHAQPICRFMLLQALDISVQTLAQTLDLAQDLRSLPRRQAVKVLDCRLPVLDFV